MSLAKQIAAISLAQGIDTRTDPKQVMAGKLLTLENGIFSNPKSIRKRYGFSQLSNTIINPPTTATSTTVGKALTAYRGELLMADGERLYSYDVGNQGLVDKGPFISATVTQQSITRNTYQQTSQDGVMSTNGLYCSAWNDTQGGVRYSILDSASGQPLVPSTQLSANGAVPKTLATANAFLIFYVNTSDHRLHLSIIPTVSPFSSPNDTVFTSTSGHDAIDTSIPSYDATIFNTSSGLILYVAFNNLIGGTTVKMSAANSPRNVLASAYQASHPALRVTVFGDLKYGGPVVAAIDELSLGTMYVWAYDFALKALIGSTTAFGGTLASNLVGISTSATALSLNIFSTDADTDAATGYKTRLTSVTGSYSATAVDLITTVSVATKPFLYNGSSYVYVNYASTVQPTYFVVRDDGLIVAKILSGNAGGELDQSPMPETSTVNTSIIAANVLQLDPITTSAGVILTQTGVTSVSLDFNNQKQSYRRQELALNMHWSGGYLWMYDGLTPVEHGFHVYPEQPGVSLGSSGKNLSAGRYQWCAVYAWTDNEGQVHRSSPSVVAAAIATAGQEATITVYNLALTAKQGTRANAIIEIYRTKTILNDFFLVTSAISPQYNDPNGAPLVFVDNTSDDDLGGNPPLYTTTVPPIVLSNIAPNALGALTTYQNRLWGIDTTDPLTLWYSKQIVPGAPVEFSNFLTMSVDPRGGPVRALEVQNDKLLIFKDSHIFFTYGQGPDNTGANGVYQDPQLFITDSGTDDPRSIVRMPLGLFYKSEKGIQLVDSGLNVLSVGDDVTAYNGLAVTGAQLDPASYRVLMTLEGQLGPSLVYDYSVKQWVTYTLPNGVDVALWNGLLCYLRADGTFYQETPSVYTDDGQFIKLKLKTSWLQIDGIQGFLHYYKILLVGEWYSPHQILAQIGYDFNESAPSQTILFTPTSPGTYGSASPYGQGVYGGNFVPYQFRLFPNQPKCQAMQLYLEDVQMGAPGESAGWSAISLEYGVKQGLIKAPSSRSFG